MVIILQGCTVKRNLSVGIQNTAVINCKAFGDGNILRAIEKKDNTQNAMIEAVKARIGGMTDDGRSNDEGI